MIPQKNISKISNDIYKEFGGKRIPEVVIERDYCLTWFLKALGQSSLRDYMAFKGGTCLRRCFFKKYRFSEDLDFTLVKKITRDEIIEKLVNEIFPKVKSEVGIDFEMGQSEEDSLNTHTFYLCYEGPIPLVGKKREVKVDITFHEKIVTNTEYSPILKSYDEYTDFEECYDLLTYSRGEVIVEKICALTDQARCEARDLYDIWNLMVVEKIEIDFLKEYIQEKLESKGSSLTERNGNYAKKEKRLKKAWQKRLAGQRKRLFLIMRLIFLFLNFCSLILTIR